MMRGIRLTRLFGVEVRLDWSWVLIFVLLTWNLVAVFSLWHPGWSPAGNLAVAMSASLIFFLCILVHELAHSLVAKAYGHQVRSITLFLFGGVSDIDHEPRSAGAEFFTAIVGPITSFLLGVAFLLLASGFSPVATANAETAMEVMSHLGPLTTLLAWLGPINIVIAIFNMVPAFPLDGGRVLRSILWGISGDLRRATRWAAGVGQLVGWLFIASGIGMSFGANIPFFGTGLAGGLWLAFIGWFIYSAASQATKRLAIDDALAGLTVRHLMRRDVPAVTPELSLATLVEDYLVRGSDRALPVLRDERLLGLVCVSDARKVPPDEWARIPVSAVMRGIEALTVASPEKPLAQAFEQLARLDIDQLPVIENGSFVGMLRRRDVTRWLELAWKPTAESDRTDASRPRGTPTHAPGAPSLPHRQEPHPGSV